MGVPAWLQAAAHPLETLRKLPEATLWEDQEGVGGHPSAVWRALNALVARQRREAGSRGGCSLGISVPHQKPGAFHPALPFRPWCTSSAIWESAGTMRLPTRLPSGFPQLTRVTCCLGLCFLPETWRYRCPRLKVIGKLKEWQRKREPGGRAPGCLWGNGKP